MSRHDGRKHDEMRKVTIEPGYLKYPHGSVLISFGNTKVICSVMVDEKVPAFLEGRAEPQGWITAEYALLPASGFSRNSRAGYGSSQVKGRVHEIQRLVGRALRAALNLKKIGSRTLMIDCDVIQADGGTRTASITGAMVALELAAKRLIKEGKITESPITSPVAAISLGVVKGNVLLDLDYIEDSEAETDLNLVMNNQGGFIEVQGTAEKGIFQRTHLDEMLRIGEQGIKDLFALQKKALEAAK
jgi:ribonuclease PH